MKVKQHPEIVVQARRGGTVESVHRAVAALAGPDGDIVERWGDPGMVTFWRSSAKPFQAQAWLCDGTVEQFGWGTEQLAIMSASHDGLDFQAGLVREMLADLGLSEADLRCDGELKARHNCSGNHTGFLAASVHHGWDVPTYQRPDHPAQEAALQMFAACVGLDPRQIATGVDGCGVVCYATPVTAAAATFALMPDLLPEISAAMRAHPQLVEGPTWFDTILMETMPEATSKSGAEGLGCVSLPDGRGLSVKVVDGADRAMEPAALAVLGAVLGPEALPERLATLARPAVKNDAGDTVGDLLAVIPG
jgi:L-asparaginase II